MSVRWRLDRATLDFLAENNVSNPREMTPMQLAEAMTYIEREAYSSKYALELCYRAGNIEAWNNTNLRRKAVIAAAKSFGIAFC